MRHWIFLVAASLGLSACASNGAMGEAGAEGEPVADAGGKTEVVCRRVRKLGSNFRETVCMTREQMEQEAEDARREMDRQRTQQQRIRNKGPVGN